MEVQLVVLRGHPQGRSLHFRPGRFLFGRGDECHLRSTSAWISRQHCLFEVGRDMLELHDLGSTNGTLVNGERIRGCRRLKQGDLVQIGSMVLQVSVDPFADPEGADRAKGDRAGATESETGIWAKDTLNDC